MDLIVLLLVKHSNDLNDSEEVALARAEEVLKARVASLNTGGHGNAVVLVLGGPRIDEELLKRVFVLI